MHIIVVGALGADMGTIIVETWCQLLRWSSKIPVIRSLQEIRPLRLVSLSFSVWGLSALPEPELWQRNLGMGTGTQMQRKAKNHCITLYQYGMISWVSCHVCLHCYSDDLSSSFLFLLIHIEVWSNTYCMISYSVNISDSTRLPQDVEHQESASAQEPSGQVARCGVCSYSWQLRMADVVWQSHHKSAWIPGLEVAFAKCSQSRWTAELGTEWRHILFTFCPGKACNFSSDARPPCGNCAGCLGFASSNRWRTPGSPDWSDWFGREATIPWDSCGTANAVSFHDHWCCIWQICWL